MNNLRIEFIPFDKLKNLSLKRKINLIVSTVRRNSVLIIDGKLSAEEEAKLIEETMKRVSKSFPGVEICSFNSADFRKKEKQFFDVIKETVLDKIVGRRGITIIGPAAVVKNIRKDPDKVSLLLRLGR